MKIDLRIPAERRRPALVLLVVVGLLFFVFVCTTIGQRFDDTAKLFGATHELSRRLRRDGLPTFKHLSTLVAAGSVFAVIVAISLWHGRRLLRALGGALIIAVPPVLIAEVLKVVLPRPTLLSVPDYLQIATFPSGHTAVVAGCAAAFFVSSPPQRRGLSAVLAGIVVSLQVALVVAGGRHRPSDAVGAVLLSVVWVLVSGAAPRSGDPVFVQVPRRLASVTAAAAVVGGAAALLAAPSTLVPNRAASSRCMAITLVWAIVVGVEFARQLLVHLATARMLTDREAAPVLTFPRRARR